ncbi:hypothetical protein PX52LOC_04362 [Limnoglobus roseus]|uniref:Uncharacterized protein n=1 Tax=Limnoglobus roseus TaxID=2598579 RepID=A0A5C1AGT5_9BACT|nr:hypothetical protein PX52LOC_04362 [Limnoglobus roseus]
MPRVTKLSKWLASSVNTVPNRSYRHRVLKETSGGWQEVEAQLKRYFRRAHSDAVRRLRRLATGSLHPLRRKKSFSDPAKNYPHALDLTTLKGYFGEVISSAVAESFDVCGHNDWEVPGFLFRVHVGLFQKLEAQRLTGGPIGAPFGRTGDDSLAFRRDDSGAITGVLYCEAKCSAEHDTSLIADAHEKVNGPGPLDVLSIIEMLLDSREADSDKWVDALRTYRETLPHGIIPRFDVVCYTCGKSPTLNPTWMDTKGPHPSYKPSGRQLESVEIHLLNVVKTIRAIYSPEGWA